MLRLERARLYICTKQISKARAPANACLDLLAKDPDAHGVHFLDLSECFQDMHDFQNAKLALSLLKKRMEQNQLLYQTFRYQPEIALARLYCQQNDVAQAEKTIDAVLLLVAKDKNCNANTVDAANHVKKQIAHSVL